MHAQSRFFENIAQKEKLKTRQEKCQKCMYKKACLNHFETLLLFKPLLLVLKLSINLNSSRFRDTGWAVCFKIAHLKSDSSKGGS